MIPTPEEIMLDELTEDELLEIDEEVQEEIVAVPVVSVFPAKKINYLNNKDMLKEIHKSKSSFSEFTDPKYDAYDVIVQNLEDIFLPEVHEKGKAARAARLAAQAYEFALSNAVIITKADKPRLIEYKIKPETILVPDLVFRVVTYEHIPLAPGRKKNPKTVADSYAKLNFQPFKHYIIEGNIAKEVGRSHTRKGKFNLDFGSITNKLAKMFILMVNKYGQRGNWRNYCVDIETDALTERGWLSIDDINETDKILSYNGDQLAWSSIKSVYRGDYCGKMHHLTQQGLDSLVTPNHKLVTDRGLVPVEYITTSDKITLLGSAVLDNNESYHDAFVHNVNIESISFELVALLSTRQRAIVLDKLIGDTNKYSHSNKEHIDVVQALCAMLGRRAIVKDPVGSTQAYTIDVFSTKKNRTNGSRIDFNGGRNSGRNSMTQLGRGKVNHPNNPTVKYSGRVWCPETEYGCFVARRKNTVFLTGNTYIDEMKGQALLQLSQMGLQFNEAKSDNPFSYYTASVSNSFTRVLNLEKKNQDLRDDLLIDSGASPSFSRQLAIEGEIRRLREDAQEAAKNADH